jgi:hypothetical protein
VCAIRENVRPFARWSVRSSVPAQLARKTNARFLKSQLVQGNQPEDCDSEEVLPFKGQARPDQTRLLVLRPEQSPVPVPVCNKSHQITVPVPTTRVHTQSQVQARPRLQQVFRSMPFSSVSVPPVLCVRHFVRASLRLFRCVASASSSFSPLRRPLCPSLCACVCVCVRGVSLRLRSNNNAFCGFRPVPCHFVR